MTCGLPAFPASHIKMNLPTNLCDNVVTAQEGAPVIGVLALHGGYHEHKVMLSRLGCMVREIRQVLYPPGTTCLSHSLGRRIRSDAA